MELCLKLSKYNTIILFDDTNIQYLNELNNTIILFDDTNIQCLNELCSKYVKDDKLKDYYFDKYLNNQKYKHRFLQVKNIKIPVYISITSIFKNQDILLKTLQSIIKQTRLPDKIFLYLSEESYLLDDGFNDKKITNLNLLNFVNDTSIIIVKWVKNTGSYRKLLPLLKDKWEEDCIIITIDDDTVYDINLIENLIENYKEQGCVIGFRGFTPLFDKLENFNYSKRDELKNLSLYNFLTGKGGILYKPEFFYKTKDLIFDDRIYLNTCDKQDDIWFYILRILNDVYCYINNTKYMNEDLNNKGLYLTFNYDSGNNDSIKKTIEILKELGYKFE